MTIAAIKKSVPETIEALSKLETIYLLQHKKAMESPYNEVRLGVSQKARNAFKKEKAKLIEELETKYNSLFDGLRETIKGQFTATLAPEESQTLQLWLMAETISEDEINALYETHVSNPFAMKLIIQLAKKHGFNTAIEVLENSLDNLLHEIKQTELLQHTIFKWILSGAFSNTALDESQNTQSNKKQYLDGLVDTFNLACDKLDRKLNKKKDEPEETFTQKD
ncbi:MAG: hypothetical protein LBV67_08360, partial [Streptococcaceae bacterium]|nr:hypothetical protein [Streptococcaceae bacterium]